MNFCLGTRHSAVEAFPRILSSSLYISEEEDHKERAASDTSEAAASTVAARLYFTDCGLSANLTSLQHFLKKKEAHHTSPLLQVLQIAPPSVNVAEQPLVYVEEGAVDETESPNRRAVLTTCSSIWTRKSPPPRWYETSVDAVLSVFQDYARECPVAAAPQLLPRAETPCTAFWGFLEDMISYHAAHFCCRNGDLIVELQGIVVPAFETSEDAAYTIDVFSEYRDKGIGADGGESCVAPERKAAQKVRITSTEALSYVMTYLRQRWPRLEADVGSSHLVMYAKWTSSALTGKQGRRLPSDPPSSTEKTACFVWLHNDDVARGVTGVYADAALEVLLDELALAAASASTPTEAAAILEEDGLCTFFEACCLTHTLRRVIRKHFGAVVLRSRQLFQWVLSVPPQSQLSAYDSDTSVTTVHFDGDDAVSNAVFHTAAVLVHWQQLLDATQAMFKAMLKKRFGKAGVAPRTISSAQLQISGTPPRVPRIRRAIQQSGASKDHRPGGSALDRQRGKLNIPHLYGTEDGGSVENSLTNTPRETFLGASGTFHSLRSAGSDSFHGTPLLKSAETLALSPRLARNKVERVKRTPRSSAVSE